MVIVAYFQIAPYFLSALHPILIWMFIKADESDLNVWITNN